MKTFSRFTEDTEKGIKVYRYEKSSIHKGRQKDRKEEMNIKQTKQLTRL